LTKALRDERGLATLETTFAITILVPLLFSVLEFGAALERWLAQDAATVQAARYAGELGGDAPELRRFLDDELRAAGIDASRVSVEVVPARVGWREPVRVSLSSAYPVSIPFLFSTTVPLRSSAISRGEVNR
jgi:Flp pilus assembly protein TadG